MANAEQTAQGLASLGRYGDSVMVHMKPEEVAGLQQLAEAKGTTLTINPETGMPEAFLGEFLESILPTAAGAVGGAFGGPMGAAAAGALTTALQGKTEPLQIAMGGLSGYGGGQIGSALGGGTAPLAGSAEALTAAGTPEALAAQTFNAPVSNVMGANQMANVSNLPTAQLNQVAANNLQHLSNKNLRVPVEGRPDLSPFSQAGGQGYSPFEVKDTLMESSVGDLAQDPFVNNQYLNPTATQPAVPTDYPNFNVPEYAKPPGDPLGGRIMGPGGSTISTGPAYQGEINPVNTSVNNATSFQPEFGAIAETKPYVYEAQSPLEKGLNLGDRYGDGLKNLKAAGSGITNAWDNPTEFLERLGGKEYYDASGQLVNEGGKGSALYGGLKLGAPVAMAGAEGYYADLYDTVDPITRGGPSGPLNLSDTFRPSMTLPMYAQGGMVPSYQAGGIAGLGYGGLLEGRGDGISDSIPARIDGSQEAALSEGEFVVPARIVSEIGNGSSNAGAERLYAMMDRIEKDRERTTGQGNIAVDTNAERRLPV